MRVECSNKGHRDSNSCIVLVRSSLRILKRDALLRRLSIWIFSRHKKATVSDMKQWLSDDHDSQEVPEENTGTYWLDIFLRTHPLGIPDVPVGNIVAFGSQ